MATTTKMEQQAFNKARTEGRAAFNSLPTNLKWEAGDELVIGSFSVDEWSDICGYTEIPPKGWRTGFAEACERWEMSVHG